MQPKVVQSTERSGYYPASSVLIWAEEDERMARKANFWLAEEGKTTGQGFTMRVDRRYSYMPICKRMIAGIQIRNTRNGAANSQLRATNEFQVSGS